MVRLTHKMAIASDLVRADGIEAMEFPHLSIRYGVRGVPRTIVNETLHIDGLVPEGKFLQQILAELKAS